MNISIKDIVQIRLQKNGRYTIKRSASEEANAYLILREMGYRRAKIGSEFMYYQRTALGVEQKRFYDLRDSLMSFLKPQNFNDWPEDLNRVDIANFFYRKGIVKENDLLKDKLKDLPTTDGVHLLRYKDDVTYRNDFDRDKMLRFLEENEFKTTIDSAGSIATGHPLFYKAVSQEQYLIFSYINNHNSYCFDCWLAQSKSANIIGTSKLLSVKEVVLSFELERDMHLLSTYNLS